MNEEYRFGLGKKENLLIQAKRSLANPGEFFGELASLLDQERSASIISKGSSVVQVYSADNLQDMIEEHPELAMRIISTLAKRLSQATRKIGKLQKELEDGKREES